MVLGHYFDLLDPTVSFQEQELCLILLLTHCRAEHRAGLPEYNLMVVLKVLACLKSVPVAPLCFQNQLTRAAIF